MGIYLNPVKKSFKMAVDSRIYVDKTSMIHYTIVWNCFIKNPIFNLLIVVDEWDVIFRTRKKDKESQKIYLSFLRDCDGLKESI